jgi:hypothetical protein
MKNPFRRDRTKTVLMVLITDDCFERLKRSGETEVLTRQDGVEVAVRYLKSTPYPGSRLSLQGKGCYIVDEGGAQ